jgi:hypothetical protein
MKYPQYVVDMFKSALTDDDTDAMNIVAHECAHHDHNSGAMDKPGYTQNWYYDLANQSDSERMRKLEATCIPLVLNGITIATK